METLPELTLVRAWRTPVALRADDGGQDDGALAVMEVRFSAFDTWYRVDSWWEGTFLERTVRGAFKRTIAAHNAARNKDSHNIKTLFNHGMDFHIGDKILGAIDELSEQPDSPLSVVRLFDTSYNRDLLPGLRAEVYGSSFMFRVIKQEWDEEPELSDHNPDGVPERTLKEVRVFEAGPVTWPANPDATAGVRCLSTTDTYYEFLARQRPAQVEQMRAKLIALRSGEPVIDTSPAIGLAPARETDSVDSRHSVRLTPGERRQRLYPELEGMRTGDSRTDPGAAS